MSECGAGMLELDVHLTRDKEVVVAHDQNLLRTAGRDADIRDLAYAELPRMRDTVTVDFCPGESFCDTTTVMEERRLPRLEEVLTQFPDTQLNIDVKADLLRMFDDDEATTLYIDTSTLWFPLLQLVVKRKQQP